MVEVNDIKITLKGANEAIIKAQQLNQLLGDSRRLLDEINACIKNISLESSF